LHCLYDGNQTDGLYKILTNYNVKVHVCRIPFENEIYNLYTEDYMKKNCGFVISKASLRARFLRFLISEIENDDDYILYCDIDILFLKDISLKDFPALPEYISAGPEFDKNDT